MQWNTALHYHIAYPKSHSTTTGPWYFANVSNAVKTVILAEAMVSTVTFSKGRAQSTSWDVEKWCVMTAVQIWRHIYKYMRLARLTWIKLFIGKVSEESHLSKNHPSILIWYIMTSIMSLFTVERIHFYGLGSSTATFLHKNKTKQTEHQTGHRYYSSVISECHIILVF